MKDNIIKKNNIIINILFFLFKFFKISLNLSFGINSVFSSSSKFSFLNNLFNFRLSLLLIVFKVFSAFFISFESLLILRLLLIELQLLSFILFNKLSLFTSEVFNDFILFIFSSFFWFPLRFRILFEDFPEIIGKKTFVFDFLFISCSSIFSSSFDFEEPETKLLYFMDCCEVNFLNFLFRIEFDDEYLLRGIFSSSSFDTVISSELFSIFSFKLTIKNDIEPKFLIK